MVCKELLNYKYDHSATHTRTRVDFMKDKKGICFDFVNYIYYKLDKKPSCYFIYGNNPDVFLVKYSPNNKVMSIKEFCEDKFSYPDSKLIDIKGD